MFSLVRVFGLKKHDDLLRGFASQLLTEKFHKTWKEMLTKNIVKLCCGSVGRKPREDGRCRSSGTWEKKMRGSLGKVGLVQARHASKQAIF